MRIDKFLWCVRKYKTRSLATEAIRKERVSINDEPCKASREVAPGMYISYKKEGILYRLKVRQLPKSRVSAKLVEEYIEEATSNEEQQKAEFIKMMRHYNRQKGSGRPTKKERRHLDDFMDGEEEAPA